MAKLSDSTARWWANVNDDVRSKVIDEAWFDQKGSTAMRDNVNATIGSHDAAVDQSAWGQLPEADHAADHEPSEGFYGNDHMEHGASSDLYGRDASEGAEASDLYGQNADTSGVEAEPYKDPEMSQGD